MRQWRDGTGVRDKYGLNIEVKAWLMDDRWKEETCDKLATILVSRCPIIVERYRVSTWKTMAFMSIFATKQHSGYVVNETWFWKKQHKNWLSKEIMTLLMKTLWNI